MVLLDIEMLMDFRFSMATVIVIDPHYKMITMSITTEHITKPDLVTIVRKVMCESFSWKKKSEVT